MWASWVGPVIGRTGCLLPASPALGSDSPLMTVSQVEVTRKQTLRQFYVPHVYEGSPGINLWERSGGGSIGRGDAG